MYNNKYIIIDLFTDTVDSELHYWPAAGLCWLKAVILDMGLIKGIQLMNNATKDRTLAAGNCFPLPNLFAAAHQMTTELYKAT